MERHFGGTGWIRLRSETLERLHAYRSSNALKSFDEALDALLEHS